MSQVLAKLVYIGGVVCLIVTCGLAQGKTLKLGFEAQGYPTGFVPGLRGDLFISDFSKVHLRLGYNIVRHGDAGEHQDERGGGFGLTLGYDLIPTTNHRWTVGLRTDLWFNKIDWYDVQETGEERHGESRVKVLQPTIQGGFRLPAGARFEFIPTIAFGYEVNIVTKGEEIGQGPILLLGLIVNFEI